MSGVFFVVEVRLKDGGTRVFADGATAGEMAAEVSVSLGEKGFGLSGGWGCWRICLRRRQRGLGWSFVTREMEEALPIIRHDCAHVLAQAGGGAFSGDAADYRAGDEGWVLL